MVRLFYHLAIKNFLNFYTLNIKEVKMQKVKIIKLGEETPLSEYIKIMDEFGDTNTPFFGKNEKGDEIAVFINRDSIMIETFYSNNTVKIHTIWRDSGKEEII